MLDQPFISFVHRDDRSATLHELEKLSGGQPTHGFEHRFELDANRPSLVALLDAARIQRVLGNLLSNAIKYSPDGGPVRVRISESRSTSGVFVEIVVEDEGIGIPRDDLPRIFDRLHRGSNVVRRIAGTGLGLAGVRQLVELHGGSISADSEEGTGSRFTLRPLRVVRSSA